MHVLILPSYYPNTYSPFDGIYFKVQAEALHNYGLKVGVIAPIIIKHYVLKREKKLDYGFKNNTEHFSTLLYQIPSFPIFKWMNDSMRLYFGKKLFKKYISQKGLPEIIHVHSFENGILARWIKNEYGIPYVITEHSTRFERKEYSNRMLRLAQKAFDESSASIVVSSDLKKTIQKFFGTTPQVIPNLINTDVFKPKQEEKKYTFITIGGLREPKNYERLIRCIYEVNKNSPCNLCIVGVGPLKDRLINQIKELGLGEQISLAGSKTQDEIITLLNQSKIFVSSSLIETFGVAIIEAMSCGLPVVATKSGGPEYYMTENYLGELCEQTDESLFTAMKNILNNYESFDSFKIRQYIIDRFSAKVISSQIVEVYKNILTSSLK